MFESFNDSSAATRSRKSLAVSTVVAAVAYVGAGSALVAFATTQQAPAEKIVEVTFEKLMPKKALPPPPPPPPKVRKVVAARGRAPHRRAHRAQGGSEGEAARAGSVRRQSLKGAAATGFRAVRRRVGGVRPRRRRPRRPPKPKKLEPINLPEEAEAPVADPGNAAPGYPEAARAAGIEGRVILKIVISRERPRHRRQGAAGDPILVEAAVEVVKG